MVDLHRLIGTIVAVASHARDFLHQLYGSLVALPEDCVVAVEQFFGVDAREGQDGAVAAGVERDQDLRLPADPARVVQPADADGAAGDA